MKLGLGTVQFGLDYGISNIGGITPDTEVAAILELAAIKGVRIIDTASVYGSSEMVLGRILSKQHDFRIITKLPSLGGESGPQRQRLVEDAFANSQKKLNIDSCYALLVHNADDLCSPDGERLFEQLQRFKARGLVKKVGVSIYDSRQIDEIMRRFTIDIIQVPCNVFDQRLIVNNRLLHLKSAGIEIHARSAFLQGLLLMDHDMLPIRFAAAKSALKSFHDTCSRHALTPLQGALGFVMGIEQIDHVICGVNNLNQFKEVLGVEPVRNGLFSELSLHDESILNPSCWS